MSEGFDPKKLDAEMRRKLEEERQRAAAAPAEPNAGETVPASGDPLDIPIPPQEGTGGDVDIPIPSESGEPGESKTIAEGEQARANMKDIEDYFDREARQMSDWIQPENEESRKELQENIAFYDRLVTQVREGNVSEALAEIERRADLTHSWVETSGKVISYDPENLEKLRAMATALTDKIKNEKEEKEPEVTDEELKGYFSRILKEWEMSGSDFDSSARWLKKAMETNDYEALSYQMDTSIDVTNSNIQDVESAADDSKYIIERIKDKLKPGESPVAYLKNELWNLRRFREYVVKKNKETKVAQTESTPNSRPDAPVAPESSVVPESGSVAEGEHTPKEWRERLRGLIANAKEKLGMSESGERAKAYLAERSGALTEKAKGLGPIPEKLLRSLGERYNKLNWKYKLAISAGLIAGVGFSAVGSIPALIAGYGLVAQRGAGLAGMYVKFEKHLRETSEGKANGYWAKKEWYKKLAERSGWQRKAMAGVMAAGYTGLMSFGIHEAIGVIRGDESWGGQLHEWVKSHWPLGGSAGVQPDTTPAHPAESLSTETTEAHTPTGEAQQPTHPVETTAGDTARDVGNPDTGNADTDVPDSGEAPTAHDMKPIDANPEGNLAAKEFGAEYATPEATPEDLSAQEWRAEYAEPGNHAGAPEWRAEHTEPDFAPEAPAETPAPADTAPLAPTAEEVVSTPDTVPPDTSGAFYDVQPQPPIEDHATAAPLQPEASATPVPEHFVVNTHGLSIDPDHANAYVDAQKNIIVYGGSLDEMERTARELVNKNHSAIVSFGSEPKWWETFLGGKPHIGVASWSEGNGVVIENNMSNPDKFIGWNIPAADDLAQVYQPAN